MGAGTMAMRLFVAAHRKLRNVGEHGAAGHVDIHITRSLAALLPWHEVDLPDIRDEVRVQNTAIIFGEIFSLFGEKIRIARIEAVFENIIRVVDELRVAKELKCNRLAGKSEITARLHAAGVEVLMPGIERDCERRTPLPLEGPFGCALIPDGCRAASSSHGDDLFVELALRFSALTGIDLGDIGVGHHLIGKSANGPSAILALPIFELLRPDILHESAADDRHAFRLDPFFVRTVLVHHELNIGMNFEFFCWYCHENYLSVSLLGFS